MDIQTFYSVVSGNYSEALKRLMKDAMIIRFVKKFPGDRSFAELKENLEMKKTEEAFRAAHTLKGVAGNLALTGLAAQASEITEMLRSGNLEEAVAYFPTLEQSYNTCIDAIQCLD